MRDMNVKRLSFEGVDRAFQAQMTGYAKKFQLAEGPEGPSFQNVLGNVVTSVNDTMGKPDAMLHEAMTTGKVDVHDVMIANAKAELVVNITTQVATKVVQAYDKILQIQI